MKKHIRVLVILSLVLCLGVGIFSLSGCTKGCRKVFKHTVSNTVGLKRKIYWYTETGELFKTWEGRFNIENLGYGIAFEDDNKKETKIAGGLILIQEQ